MKIFCIYTKSHERLLNDYFKPSLPEDLDLHVITHEASGTGDCRSEGWMQCVHDKMDAVRASLCDRPGEIIIWSDIDILFFRPIAEEIESLMESSGKSILFQREGKTIRVANGGFYAVRATDQTLAFFDRVCEQLKKNPHTGNQAAINAVLETTPESLYGFLPFSYYARTHGWPPPRDLAIFHANATMGGQSLEQKYRQFRELRFIRNYGFPALLLSLASKIPKRFRRLILEYRQRNSA